MAAQATVIHRERSFPSRINPRAIDSISFSPGTLVP
jgi:hypothetical protein